FLSAIVCDWASASRISSGSTATAPRPLFWRYCDIIEAAATGSSRAPGTAMSTYIAGVSSGVSDAQATSNNVAEIAAAARSDIMSPKSGAVVAYQPWLKGEFSGLGPAQSATYSADVAIVWMPHSVLGRPRQRPARSSSSGEVRLVQGMQPTER